MNDSFPNSVSIHVPSKEPLVSKERSSLTTRQVNRIRAILMLGGLDYADLEDGLQEVRMKLLETQASVRPPIENLEAWVSVVASRVAIDWHRSQAHHGNLVRRLERTARVTATVVTPEPDLALAMLVAEELQLLSKVDRQVLVLRYFADMSVPEVAAALGIPEGTAKSRIHHATTRLRLRLQAERDPRHD